MKYLGHVVIATADWQQMTQYYPIVVQIFARAGQLPGHTAMGGPATI